MNDYITLLTDTAKNKRGTVLRIWRPGLELAADVVDAQRASQWIKDGIAEAGAVEAEVKAPRAKAAPRKRGK